MPARLFRMPFSPLAASTALESSESGTTSPSTNPFATSARRKGQGLLGETSCMELNPLKAPNSEDANSPTALLQDAPEFWRNSTPSQPQAGMGGSPHDLPGALGICLTL